MLSPLPRHRDWVLVSLTSPALSAFPGLGAGSTYASSFSRLAQRSLALRPAHSRGHQFVTRFTRGFNHFVTSIVAPVASGWSGCRVGLSPTGKAPPLHGAPYKRSFKSFRETPTELPQTVRSRRSISGASKRAFSFFLRPRWIPPHNDLEPPCHVVSVFCIELGQYGPSSHSIAQRLTTFSELE